MIEDSVPAYPVISKGKEFPLEGDHADQPGSYGLAIRIHNSVIDPGEIVEVELFISGYGQITTSKLVCCASPNLIETNSKESYVLTGLGEERKDQPTWGCFASAKSGVFRRLS
jgi:hypothetical protein